MSRTSPTSAKPASPSLARTNPKLASLSVTTIALGATQLGTLFLAISEQSAFGGPRLDRFLNGLIMIGVVWAIVVVLDLLLFPTMRMTRLIVGPALTTAALVTAFQAAFQLIFGVFTSYGAGLVHHAAGLGLSLIVYWAVISIWELFREYRSTRKRGAGVDSVGVLQDP